MTTYIYHGKSKETNTLLKLKRWTEKLVDKNWTKPGFSCGLL